MFRARYVIKGQPQKWLDLGPPNVEVATKSNRMSPAGIVMFYACDTPETAIAEIGGLGQTVMVGEFVIQKDIDILDLYSLPPKPSIFAYMSLEDVASLRFLHHFCEELSTPVMPDGFEHVEYSPTQVVTEWFRTIFRHGRRRISGICYLFATR